MLECETAGIFSFAAQLLVTGPGGGVGGVFKWRAAVERSLRCVRGPKAGEGGEPLMNSTVSPRLICAGVAHRRGRARRDFQQHTMYRARPLICFE